LIPQLEKLVDKHYIFINMKNRTIPIIFGVLAVVLAGSFFLTQKFVVKKDTSLTRAKIITPKTSDITESEADMQGTALELEKYETFVPLLTGEILISTLTVDFSNDGYDDEVIIVKNSRSPYLTMVPGLYNPESGNYERLPSIETKFSRTRAFSYSGMDLLGEHRNSLVYQGIDDDGNYVMKIFMFQTERKHNEMICVGDFASDGTVFVQQSERSESYALGLSKGESYSIWVYKTEKLEEDEDKKDSVPASQNQIQQEYRWNTTTQHYELHQEIKVTAGRLAAKELSRIQDGTVETFAAFLNGLWYKTSNTDGKIRYMYFDYEAKEIIQLFGDTQEVYEWDDSTVRHNGIYITSVNSDITNLMRRFDISLIGVDEVRITLRDYVNLAIQENAVWDGQYKKMSSQWTFDTTGSKNNIASFNRELKKDPGWSTADKQIVIAFDDYTYTLQTSDLTESGVYSLLSIGNYAVIQFRSDSESSFLASSYAMEFGKKTITEKVKRKTIEKVVTDYNNIVFTPVKFSPTDCFPSDGYTYTFTRE